MKKRFQESSAAAIAATVADLGHQLSQPPDGLDIPNDYQLSVATKWKEREVTVTVTMDEHTVSETIRFSRFGHDRGNLGELFLRMAERLWRAYFNLPTTLQKVPEKAAP